MNEKIPSDFSSENDRMAEVLPQLHAICRQIDMAFGRYVGPIAAELIIEALNIWTSTGKRTKPADILVYIKLLSVHISSAEQRLAFETEARRHIRFTS